MLGSRMDYSGLSLFEEKTRDVDSGGLMLLAWALFRLTLIKHLKGN